MAARALLDEHDVACWVLKSSRAPQEVVPGWRPGQQRRTTRCLHPSYRVRLMRPGQPCLLWISGRRAPGVHAIGALAGPPHPGDGAGGQPEVAVDWRLLSAPVPRADLLADGDLRDAEVLRMPAGSNPSYLTARQFAALCAQLPPTAAPRPGRC